MPLALLVGDIWNKESSSSPHLLWYSIPQSTRNKPVTLTALSGWLWGVWLWSAHYTIILHYTTRWKRAPHGYCYLAMHLSIRSSMRQAGSDVRIQTCRQYAWFSKSPIICGVLHNRGLKCIIVALIVTITVTVIQMNDQVPITRPRIHDPVNNSIPRTKME
jgi:hypothetical protein